mgnify:CR=1 FL=1
MDEFDELESSNPTDMVEFGERELSNPTDMVEFGERESSNPTDMGEFGEHESYRWKNINKTGYFFNIFCSCFFVPICLSVCM